MKNASDDAGKARDRCEEHDLGDEQVFHVVPLHPDGAHGADLPGPLPDGHPQRVEHADEYDEKQYKAGNHGHQVQGRLKLENVVGASRTWC